MYIIRLIYCVPHARASIHLTVCAHFLGAAGNLCIELLYSLSFSSALLHLSTVEVSVEFLNCAHESNRPCKVIASVTKWALQEF